MRFRVLLVCSMLLICAVAAHSGRPGESNPIAPRYSADGSLLFPEGYREWIYLSSGLGMAYGDKAGSLFTNVFVTPAAYREFLSSGKWPERSMFVVEERESSSVGSINKSGHYQAGVVAVAVEVKDSARFPETWTYFTFRADATTAKPIAKGACWQCHDEHGAVEHSFVQFYPTLQPIARKFGTYKESSGH